MITNKTERKLTLKTKKGNEHVSYQEKAKVIIIQEDMEMETECLLWNECSSLNNAHVEQIQEVAVFGVLNVP